MFAIYLSSNIILLFNSPNNSTPEIIGESNFSIELHCQLLGRLVNFVHSLALVFVTIV